MPYGGPESSQLLTALYDFSPLQPSLSNVLPETYYPHTGRRLPTIQTASPNKGVPSPTSTQSRPALFPLAKGYTHANITASSSSSTTESISELTSSSSRDSLPATHPRSGDITSPGQARNYKRGKPGRPGSRWTKGGGSSEDTGSERKRPTAQPSRAARTVSEHAQPNSRPHQPYIATQEAASSQGQLMATTFGSPSGDSRRGVASPRPKGRGMTAPSLSCASVPCLTMPRRSQKHFLSQCHHLWALSVRKQ
jgi:PAB-dependent poly(A)-specific ribonuclease subunit 3